MAWRGEGGQLGDRTVEVVPKQQAEALDQRLRSARVLTSGIGTGG